MIEPMAKAIDQFRPLGDGFGQGAGVADKPIDGSREFDRVVDVVVEVESPRPAPGTVVRTKSAISRQLNIERQIPKFPHGLFNRRDWDIGRDFESLEEIGRGKDTMIYKGTCLRPIGDLQEAGKTVAIKVYFKNKVTHTKLRAIKREVAMMAFMERKGVPNIVKALDAFADDLHYYIVMEYCEGGDLLEWILKRKKALHERDALASIVVPLLNTLCQIHSMGIIHRDIKLENIFLGRDLRVLLGDFGLTMSSHQESAISPVGTVEYMAPEVLALPPVDMIMSKAIDPLTIRPNDDKVDIWALGVTLFELVTGKLPFNGKDKVAIKHAITSYQLSSFPECVSIGCRNIILDMLTYKADDRPSAFTLKRRITRFLAGESPTLGRMSLHAKQTQGSSNDESQTKMEAEDIIRVDANRSASSLPSQGSNRWVEDMATTRSGGHGLGGFGRVLRKLSSSRRVKNLFDF